MGRRETPVDPAAGPVQRLAHELRALRREAGGPTYREMARRAHYSVTSLSQAAAGEALPSLAVTLAYVEACGGDRAEWERRWHATREEAAARTAEDDDTPPPYQGLARFEPGDHDRFFGRAELTTALCRAVAGHRFTALFGASGSGKSSLLRAGLIPALRRGGDAGGGERVRLAGIRILTPGEHPMTAHADVLRPRGKHQDVPAGGSGTVPGVPAAGSEVAPAVRAGGSGAGPEVHAGGPGAGPVRGPRSGRGTGSGSGPGTGDTLVVVDQFEELFTLCPDAAERAAFIDRLLTACRPDSGLRVVVAVRADFYGRCVEHRALAEALRTSTVPVGPMTREELREVIVRPAQAAGFIVERPLTARLVDEVHGTPGGLPLLSHVLRETWRRRRGRVLTEEAYRAAGGLEGAIAQTAEDVYAGLSPDRAELARFVLLRLVAPGDGTADTRRPVDRAELETGRVERAAEIDAVLERLARARLVTLDGTTVHLAHEALITAWPRFAAWIEDDRNRLRILRRLTQAAVAWHDLGRDSGALYRGVRLGEAEESFGGDLGGKDLTRLEREFLDTSRTARARDRRRHHGLVTSAVLLLVLAVTGGAMAWQQNRDGEEARVAAAARRAATTADSLRPSQPRTALLLSVAAWRLSRTPETHSALLGALAQHERPPFTPPGSSADTDLLGADGRTLLTTRGDGFVLWDLHTRRVTATHRGPTDADTFALGHQLSPDGRYTMVGTETGTAQMRLWDVRAQRYHGPPIGPGHLLTAGPDADVGVDGGVGAGVDGADLASAPASFAHGFSSSGRSVLFHVGDRVEVWDVPSGTRQFARAYPGAEDSAAGDVSPDGRLLALCLPDGLELWDLRTDRRADTGWRGKPDCGDELSPSFTPDGRTVALQDDHGLRRIDVTSGKELPRLEQVAPVAFAFSPDGRFAAGAGSGDILLWRLDRPHGPVFRHPLAEDQPEDVRIDVRARALRYTTQSADGTQTVHSLDVGGALSAPRQGTAVTQAVHSADGSVVTVLRAGRLAVLDGRTGRHRTTLPAAVSTGASGEAPLLLSLSSDGRRLAFGWTPDESPDRPTRVTVWDTVRNRRLTDVTVPSPDVTFTGLALSPDGRTLLTTTDMDDGITLRDAADGRKLRVLRQGRSDAAFGGGGALSALSPDGGTVLTDAGALVRTAGEDVERSALDNCACTTVFSPAGDRAVVVESESDITLWDGRLRTSLGLLSGGLSKGLPGEPEQTTAVAFSPDGSTLAAAGSYGTIRLWDVASQLPLGTALPGAGDAVLSLAFDEDGRTLYASGAHVPVQRFDVDPERAVTEVCRRAGGTLTPTEWRTYLPGVPYRRVC
ncbi:hypothetical protein ACF053_25900 [Streptomyces kanasensis]|uniref:nSTAND1 domain-containing NTPase n=1 Tax=Streptomyces kanasensis TaxID=936756 RepID=UPI0036F8EF4D